MQDKKISIFIDKQLSRYVRTNFEKYVNFIKAYFEAQELLKKQADEQATRLAEIEARKGTVAHLLDAYRASLEGRHAYRETESVFRRLPQSFLSLYGLCCTNSNYLRI